MGRRLHRSIVLAAAVLAACAAPHAARAAEATAAKGVTLSIYDIGLAQVTEARSVTMNPGENVIRIGGLPVRLDPSSVNLLPAAGAAPLEILEQRFSYDLADVSHMFHRYLGRPVEVLTGSGTYGGDLVGVPVESGASFRDRPLALRRRDGSAVIFMSGNETLQVGFPNADRVANLTPTMDWKVRTDREGPQNLRISYLVDGLSWSASYEMTLADSAAEAFLSVRVAIANQSGGDYARARVRLVATERGMTPSPAASWRSGERPAGRGKQRASALRYGYGSIAPGPDRLVSSLGVLEVFDIATSLSLDRDETRHVELVSLATLPVDRFLVYDGVKFERYRTFRRNDWNYGTEWQPTVRSHIAFENQAKHGLGKPLPAGRFRLYAQREDSMHLLGEDVVSAVAPGDTGVVLLGRARSISGKRERLSYSEVRPLHEYDESFEITLTNSRTKDEVIRVVEHLYRWPEYEIVKADGEYEDTGPQRIEFRPKVAAGSTRTISYTVRYRW